MIRATLGLGVVIVLLLAAILMVMVEPRPRVPDCGNDGIIWGECRLE